MSDTTAEPTADAPAAPRRPLHRRPGIWLAAIGAVVIIGLVAMAAWGFGVMNTVTSQLTVMPSKEVFPAEDVRVPASDPDADGDALNILLLGSDSRETVDSLDDAAGNRADTIVVMNIPADGSSVTAMSIMRDNWVTIPGHGEAKINAAMAFGGVPLMVQTVEEFIGTRIDHVALVDFEGFQGLTDALGGVTVDNSVAFSTGKFTYEAGPITLNGKEALSYVRERYSFPDGDYQRVRNQQAYLRGVLKGLTSSGDPGRLVAAADAVAPYVAVDDGFSVPQLVDLGVRMQRSGADLNFFTSPTLGTGWSGAQSIVVVDWVSVAALRQAFANGTLAEYAASVKD